MNKKRAEDILNKLTLHTEHVWYDKALDTLAVYTIREMIDFDVIFGVGYFKSRYEMIGLL